MEESGDEERSCPSCGVSLGPAASYCPSCGDSLPDGKDHYCHRCGTEFSRGDEFCSSCGAPRFPDQHHQEDNVGSTRQSQSTGPVNRDQAWQNDRTEPDSDVDQESYDRFKRRVNGHLEAGWEIHQDYGDRVVLVKRDVGSLWVHALLLLFTYGIGNMFYALYRYTAANSYKRLSMGDGQKRAETGESKRQRSPSTAPDTADGGSDGAMYLVGGILLIWGLALIATGSTGAMLVGGILALLGTGVLPPVTSRLNRRRSLTTFGTVTSTTDRTVENDPATCVVCGAQTEQGLEREYKKERVFAGFPIATLESGTNRYCPDCGLTHAVRANAEHRSPGPTTPERDPHSKPAADQPGVEDELQNLYDETASTGGGGDDTPTSTTAEQADDEPPTADELESWEFGTDR